MNFIIKDISLIIHNLCFYNFKDKIVNFNITLIKLFKTILICITIYISAKY